MEGLWTAAFSNARGSQGSGVVVFQGGTVLGGDSGYYYKGAWAGSGGSMIATVQVIPFQKLQMSVFGEIGKPYTLMLSGQYEQETATLVGYAVELPQIQISVRLTKRL